jgi:Dolichyl-phosphate-mannose-protein mannosyltransferase
MRRAMHVLAGEGPQEVIGSFAMYDHPYFGQLFLAGALGIIDYPKSLNPSIGDVQSIEMLYMAPKVLMGLLAIVDTFLIYEISQRRYNKNVALIASILFAVMPITWLLRGIWLDCIQLPFLLSSILCAVYMKSYGRNKKNILILLSGIFLGIAIFTKIPVFTMIPVIGFLIFTNNNRNLKSVGLWFFVVILIPMIWPAYSIYAGQFSSWLHGIYGQSHREGNSILDTLNDILKKDSVMAVLAIFGLVFAALKKDFLILLWTIPFLIFLSFMPGTSYYHFVPILPALCIGAARLIEFLSRKITTKKMQRVLPFVLISGIGMFGLISTIMLITTNVNSSYFKAAAFLPQYLSNSSKIIGNNNDKITVISDPFYLWIPQYVFHLKHDYLPFYMVSSIKTEKVVFLIDPTFLYGVSTSAMVKKIYNLYTTNKLQTIEIGDPMKNGIELILTEHPGSDIIQDHVTNLIDMNHSWKSLKGATVSHNDSLLDITVNSNNTNRMYSGAVLHTQISLKDRPLLLYLKYASKSLTGKANFLAEVTQDEKEGTTSWDYLLNTLYAEITQDEKEGMTPWADLIDTFNGEVQKGIDRGKIIWSGLLDHTSDNLTSETFVFPRLGAFTSSESEAGNPIQIRLYVVTEGIGVHNLAVKEFNVR